MKKKHAYLHSFHSIAPKNLFAQTTLIDWVVAAHLKSQEFSGETTPNLSRLKRFAVNEVFIKKRYTEYGDSSRDWENHSIYSLTANTPYGVDIKKRNQFYTKIVTERIKEFYENKSTPDHFIHVTCTGYVSPSAPQLFFSTHPQSPQITHAYHMGCYASLPAIRMARAFSLEDNKKVDVIHNEICSIHLDPSNHLPEQIVVQTLFADGHIYYQVSQEEKDLRILGIKEKIIPETSSDMSWVPAPHGMSMTLSRKVPDKIEDHILSFVMEMAREFEVDLAHMIKTGVFAIHPGGPRIIEVVKNKLELRDDQVLESKKILYERGNMSSATLPHVWNEILNNNYPRGTLIISLAFGPGLTVFGSIFEVV